MTSANRLMLWVVRLGPALFLIPPICLLVLAGHWYWRVIAFLLAALAALLVFAGGRQFKMIVVESHIDGSEIHFRRWDGQKLVVPRRGRALRKDSMRSNAALVVLNTPEKSDSVAFVKRDREAASLLADLERKGIVRGPGEAKNRIANPLIAR